MTIAVLITRPERSGLALADQLRTRWGCGVEMVLSPIMRIEDTGATPELQQAKTLIFTSQHGVAAFVRQSDRRDLPCYAVGPATAEIARSEGFNVIATAGDAESLLAEVMAARPPSPCLHIRGDHAAGEVAQRLTAAGVLTTEAVLYRQTAQPLSNQAQECLRRETPVILPLYSPRSAELLFSELRATAPLYVAALSTNVAAQVPKGSVNSLSVAKRPEAEAMLEAMDGLLSEAKQLEGAKRAQ